MDASSIVIIVLAIILIVLIVVYFVRRNNVDKIVDVDTRNDTPDRVATVVSEQKSISDIYDETPDWEENQPN